LKIRVSKVAHICANRNKKNTYIHIYISGWWFGTWLLFFHILGISSSQLTFIFFRGVETTNQYNIYIIVAMIIAGTPGLFVG
jgi:hypothetical protein